MSETTTPAPANPEVAHFVRRATGATKRYRAMAWITGTLLLALCVEVVLRYVVHVPHDVLRYIQWIPYAHGWVYIVYLVSVFDLWSVMRWRFGRLVTMAAAGVVPAMSFILERKVHAQAFARIEHARAALGEQGS